MKHHFLDEMISVLDSIGYKAAAGVADTASHPTAQTAGWLKGPVLWGAAAALAAGVLAPLDSLSMLLRQLHPILAALAMAMSSISVVSNSLRLYRAKIR